MAKIRIRKNDTVQVISGAESGRQSVADGEDERLRGRRGRVLNVDHETNRVTVDGLHMVFKHQRMSRDPSRPNVGRVEKEAPMAASNVMLVCPKCDAPTRVGIREESHEREGGGTKIRRVRVCKKCGADIPERS
jgi:large subunit ribosomal protein L24